MPHDATAAVAALAEPARRQLYEYVVAQPSPVGREQAAAALGMPLHRARFHLERLEQAGLLEADYARLSGRGGPGAGRPAKRYRRAEGEVTVSLPPRGYDLAGSVLAGAIEAAAATGEPVADAVARVARERGRALGGELGTAPAPIASQDDPEGTERRSATVARDGDPLAQATDALVRLGYEPHRVGVRVELANCPFDALSREHTGLVCGMNEALLGGLVETLAPVDLRARLDPAPGRCCVVLERDASDPR